MSIVYVRLDGADPAAVAAARDLLEEALGEHIHLGQVRPSRHPRYKGTSLCSGSMRVGGLITRQRAVGDGGSYAAERAASRGGAE